MARHPEVPNLMESMRDECSSEWSRNFPKENGQDTVWGLSFTKYYRIEDFSSFANRVTCIFLINFSKIVQRVYTLSLFLVQWGWCREEGMGVNNPAVSILLTAFFRIIQDIWFLARSSVSLKGSFPRIRRLPSGSRAGRSHPLAGLV